MRAKYWRLDNGIPVLVECTTDVWVGNLQPLTDGNGTIVQLGITHFSSEADAVQSVILNKQRDIEALTIEQEEAQAKVDALGIAIKEAETILQGLIKKPVKVRTKRTV